MSTITDQLDSPQPMDGHNETEIHMNTTNKGSFLSRKISMSMYVIVGLVILLIVSIALITMIINRKSEETRIINEQRLERLQKENRALKDRLKALKTQKDLDNYTKRLDNAISRKRHNTTNSRANTVKQSRPKPSNVIKHASKSTSTANISDLINHYTKRSESPDTVDSINIPEASDMDDIPDIPDTSNTPIYNEKSQDDDVSESYDGDDVDDGDEDDAGIMNNDIHADTSLDTHKELED